MLCTLLHRAIRERCAAALLCEIIDIGVGLMSQPSRRPKGRVVVKDGDELLVRTVNRTPGAARPRPVSGSKNNQAAPARVSLFHAP